MLTYNVLNDYVERMKKNDLAIVSTTNDIKTLTTDDINKLRAGDIVLKEDESGKHAYVVSYKKDGTGICLTYTDATYIETISYDYNSTTKEWAYNSMDATEVQPKLTAGDNVTITNNVISATDTTYTAGTNVSITDGVISASDTTYTAGNGIDITDGVISATGGSSAKYIHYIRMYHYLNYSIAEFDISFIIISDKDSAYNRASLLDYFKNIIGVDKGICCSGMYNSSAQKIIPSIILLVNDDYYHIQGFQANSTNSTYATLTTATDTSLYIFDNFYQI